MNGRRVHGLDLGQGLGLDLGLVLALVVVAGCAAGSASAQVYRKPDAAPVRQQDEYSFDSQRWNDLYQQGGEPTILVLAGLATAERAGRGVGATLNSIDAQGDSFVLKSEIERTLLEGRNVEIANLDALSEIDRRDAALLLQSRERDAVDLLSTAVDAPLVMVARLQPVNSHGAKYRVTFEAIDVPRGRTLSTVAFDWQEGDDARSIKRYARLLVNDFMDGYERRVASPEPQPTGSWDREAPAPEAARPERAVPVAPKQWPAMPYTVRILGADFDGLRGLVSEIERVPGVESVRVLQRQQARDTSIAELRVRYTGSAFDLTGDLMDSARLGGQLELDSLDMAGGSVVVRAVDGPAKMEGFQGFRMLGASRETVDRQALAESYDHAGQPRVAMLIGRSLSPWELQQPWFAQEWGRDGTSGPGSVNATADRGGSNVFITIADNISNRVDHAPGWWGGVVTPSYTPSECEQGLLSTQRFEDLMVDALGPGGLGLRVVDTVTLRERALAENPRFVFREAELIELIRQTALADVAVFGSGRLERERGYTIVRYTMRAVELESGEILAVAPAAVEVDDRADSDEVNGVLEMLAAQASARLAQDLTLAWSR
ncbi:MAG: hypothetical protein IPJ41_06265 [Phycisphaerales bacterium]|nr:hypothetical protein [Phycisphaerales bacterium]